MNTQQQTPEQLVQGIESFEHLAETTANAVDGFTAHLPVDKLIYTQQLIAMARARIRETSMLFNLAIGVTPDVHPDLAEIDDLLSQLLEKATHAVNTNIVEFDDNDDAGKFEQRLLQNEHAAANLAQAHMSGLSAVLHMSAALDLIDSTPKTRKKETQREKSPV